MLRRPRAALPAALALVLLVASLAGLLATGTVTAAAGAAVATPDRTSAPPPTATALRAAAAAAPASDLRVAVANVREGSLVFPAADRRDGTDRRRAAARILARGAVPDVVLLQEVLGSAGAMASALNARPKAKRQGARYAVATRTRSAYVTGSCDGRRTGPFRVLRSSAVLVNRRTVTRVHARGHVRTWGRWHTHAWRHTGRQGHGCTEHPWVRVSVRHPGTVARSALVANVHAAPVGRSLKTRAARVVQQDLGRRHRNRPGHRVVLGGDFNLTRCDQPLRSGEKEHCSVRTAHRRMLDAGYRDVVRALHTTGPTGVVGASHRVDFLYSLDTPRASWWDRCYQAWQVHRWRCSAKRTVFATEAGFDRCQARSLHHGRAGNGCAVATFRRYYSDHPAIIGTVR